MYTSVDYGQHLRCSSFSVLLISFLTLALTSPLFATDPGLTLAGPDGSGEYDLVWATGLLEQTPVLGQGWTSVGVAGNSYHIAPASDVGNNRFFRVHDGQSFSTNILGYVNLAVPKGFSMIANQLNGRPDNRLESIIPNPPENTIIYTFNGRSYDSFTFSADNPGWFPANGVLSPGDGGFIAIDSSQAPFGTTLTLVGSVQVISMVTVPNRLAILSAPAPVSDTLSNLGFPVRENDTFYFFRQGPPDHYVSYNYSADNPGWFPSEPRPMVGESFFFTPGLNTGRIWTRTFAVGGQ